MDIAGALELEAELLATPKRTQFVSELAQGTFWGEAMLFCNGFDVDQVKRIVATYNRFAGRDTSAEELRSTREYRELRSLLESRELPAPPELREARAGAGERQE